LKEILAELVFSRDISLQAAVARSVMGMPLDFVGPIQGEEETEDKTAKAPPPSQSPYSAPSGSIKKAIANDE